MFLITATVPALAGPEKVSPLLRKYTNPNLTGALDVVRIQQQQGVMQAASEEGIRCLIQGDVTRAQLEALGVEVRTQAGPVFTATIPPEALNAVSDLPGIVRIQPARRLHPNLDVALDDTNIEPEVHGSSSPPYSGNVGNGVLVGDVDTGFDYHHDDFRTSDDHTRFYSIWDQTASGTPPSGFSYGQEWDQTSLENETATCTDSDGHGTHVMGIIAGNGRATGNGEPQYQYIGVAPEATMVGVKTTFSDDAIIDGVDYIFQQASSLGMNAVVNLSLGSQYGPHDGTDPLDVALSNLAGAGKIIVASAGNERGAQIHARAQIATSGTPDYVEIHYLLDSYTKQPGTQNDLVLFDGYYESTDNYSITVTGPGGASLGPITRGNVDYTSTSDGAIQIDNGTATNSTGDYEVFIALYDANTIRSPASGTWTIRFTRVTSTNSNIDLWNYYVSSHMSGKFSDHYTDDVTIGSPGSGLEIVTVAAYVTKTNWSSIDGHNYGYSPAPVMYGIAPFSSRGPLRDGTLKPDIGAPGQGLFSTLSGDVNTTGLEPRIDPDGVHWILEGTSMSAPMVTGLVALILKRDPGMTPSQIKTRLADFALQDPYTHTVPNYDWGYGKIRGGAADMTDPTVTVTAPNGGESLNAGDTYNITWTASDNFSVETVDLYYSTDSGATYPNVIATGLSNSGSYPWTVPSVNSSTVRVKAVAHDPIDNTGDDASDADFSITVPDTTPPDVAVTSPNGGESWVEGSDHEITWNASDTGTNKAGGVLGAAAIAGVDSVSIWYSLDNGVNWTLIASGEENDGTYTWTVPSSPSDSALVKVEAYDPSLNVGSDESDAVFTIASATGVSGPMMPTVLSLAQNRPNPLSRAGRTEIAFGLTREGPVTLRIFDAAGRQVAVLAQGTFPAGFHSVTWDGRLEGGRRAAAGVYFYRLDTREGTQSRKLMIVN